MSDQDKPGLEPEEPTPPTAEETPAWERPEAQSPRVEEPDTHKGKIVAIVAALFVFFVLLPGVLFGVFACGAKNEFDKQYNQSIEQQTKELEKQIQQDINKQAPGASGETPSDAEKQFQQETDQLPPDAVDNGQYSPSMP